MPTLCLKLYHNGEILHRLIPELTLSRIPCVGEHILAGENQEWFLVRLVVHHEIAEDEIEADIYATKVSGADELKNRGFQ